MIEYRITDQIDRDPFPPEPWNARWVVPANTDASTGVYRFRTEIEITSIPKTMPVRVSADNRYRFYVNGFEVGIGPGRNGLTQWKFETYDIASLLKVGTNVLACVVWFADQSLAAIAQIGHAPGLLVSAVDNQYCALIDTPGRWRYQRVDDHEFFEKDEIWTYCVVGPCERIHASAVNSSWLNENFDSPSWQVPRASFAGEPYGIRDAGGRYMLVPNRLPQPVRESRSTRQIVRCAGKVSQHSELSADSPVVIPANSNVILLLDNGSLTTAYPKLTVIGGTGSRIRQRYAESLNEPGNLSAKGNRNDVDGKISAGYHDEFLPDGTKVAFEPLWYRTFRYIQLEVETVDEELTIESFDYDFTAYPFVENARFLSSDSSLSAIWTVGWRTARLCAFESYMDCPYYEQMQYVGDTRLQALISYYVSGDGRLARNAIDQIASSMMPFGLTQSRYPSNLVQIIPPFSLWWIGMLHDYWMFQTDPEFVKSNLPSARFVLEWFISKLDRSNSLLGPLPFWNFVDWTAGYMHGVPPGAIEGGSAVLTLQMVLALREQARMENVLGVVSNAVRFNDLADQLAAGVLSKCWNQERGLLAETPEHLQFSQHTNALAILAGLFDENTSFQVASHLLTDNSEMLIQSGFYFRYYVHRALSKAGCGDGYVDWLNDWHDMIDLGLTTFSENPEPVRSDCHAWSAHPLVGLLSIVLGIEPTKPGFSEVSINPHLGNLSWAEGVVPHPAGQIAVRVEKTADETVIIYHLPPGVNVKP